MGAERADVVVALQALLMIGVRTFGDEERVAGVSQRALATAASLDYVLAVARRSAGARLTEGDAERAVRDGLARAVDDAIALASAIANGGDDDARAFARQASRTLRTALDVGEIGDAERRFAVIALANP